MQYCSKCGRESHSDMNYCPYCGAVQQNSMIQNVQTHQSTVTQNKHINQTQENNEIGLSYLLGLVFSLTFQPVGFIMSLLGYFTAKSRGNHTNKTLTKAGIIISIVQFIIVILFSIVFFILMYIIIKQSPTPY